MGCSWAKTSIIPSIVPRVTVLCVAYLKFEFLEVASLFFSLRLIYCGLVTLHVVCNLL